MKKNSKIAIGILCVVVVGVLTTMYIRFSIKENIMRIAFYALPDPVVLALSTWLDDRGMEWESIVLDESQPLDTYVKAPVRYNLLFTYDSKNMDSISSFTRTARTEVLLMMPLPVSLSVQVHGRLVATPLLANHFQISCNTAVLLDQNVSEPLSIVQLENIAKTAMRKSSMQNGGVSPSITTPFLAAGNDDDHLIMFFSSLLETMSDIENWQMAATVLDNSATVARKGSTQVANTFSDFFALPQVYDTLNLIARWENQGLLSRSWLSQRADDVARVMAQEQVAFVFSPLSFVEGLPADTAKLYSSWYMPSGNNNSARYVTAPIIAVLEFSLVKSASQSTRQAAVKAETANSLINELASSSAQTALSAATKLVPVNSIAEASNELIAKTRQWFVASDGLIPDIARASLVLPEERSQFAQAIRNELLGR